MINHLQKLLYEVLEMVNYCHLSYEDRKNIEDGLNENKSH